VVCISSTIHRATGSEHVERRVKDRDGGASPKKDSSSTCNPGLQPAMGGVDMSDQFIGYYQMIHKTILEDPLFPYDVMVTNAFLLYREHAFYCENHTQKVPRVVGD